MKVMKKMYFCGLFFCLFLISCENGKTTNSTKDQSVRKKESAFSAVTISGSVVDSNGDPVANVYLSLSTDKKVLIPRVSTDKQGNFLITIPREKPLTISAYWQHSLCEDEFYTALIGPISETVTVPPIVTDLDNRSTLIALNLKGRMENCAGEVIKNGYLKMTFNGIHYIWPDDNGQILQNFLHCSPETTLNIVGYDFVSKKQSRTINYTIPADGAVDLGTIRVCDDLVEKFHYYEGDSFVIFDPKTHLDMEILNLDAYSPDSTSRNAYPELQVELEKWFPDSIL